MSNEVTKDLNLSNDVVSVYKTTFPKTGKISYRLRWYDATKKQLGLTVKNKGNALALSMQITTDITNGIYHPRDYYDPKKSLEKQALDSQYQNLSFLWNEWEKLDHQYSHTTLLTHRRIRQVLTLVNDNALKLDNAHEFLRQYRAMYADGTIYRDLAVVIACVNYWVKVGKISFNPYPAIKSVLKPKKNKHDNLGRFTDDEKGAIHDAFIKDYLETDYGGYFRLAKFLFMTGLRPEEAIPLTWHDLSSNLGILAINKTYSKGELRGNTKQGKKDKIVHRKYILNDEQRSFIFALNDGRSDDSLIFPSPENTFIDWGNFTRRHWKPIITKLVEQGKARKYLKPYCMRHTFITSEINKKTPLHIIAQQCGTSIEMIVKTYLVTDDWEIDRSGYDDYVMEYSK